MHFCIILFSIFLLSLHSAVLAALRKQNAANDIEVYRMDSFPKEKVAMHMPCEESNMFATKCMCHLRCTDQNCGNAIALCQKYRSQGCRYVLLRGSEKRIATLKRLPTVEESSRFNISAYPHNKLALDTWKTAEKLVDLKVSFSDWMSMLGKRGSEIIDRIYSVSNTSTRYCGKFINIDNPKQSSYSVRLEDKKHSFLKDGISLVVLSYHTPRTLLNSMKTWKESGLLNVVYEKIIILNDPMPEEVAISLQYGFRIVEPKTISNAKTSKSNVFTIGASFYYALQLISTDYLLFLENDFKMDTSVSVETLQKELLVGAGMLDSGIQIIRLQSRKYQGCGTFKDCDHHGIHLSSSTPNQRMRNWFAFYCREKPMTEAFVDDCFFDPDYRCFTSWDSNWTLNAVLVKKSSMLKKKYKGNDGTMRSIPEIGLSQYQHQDGFESVMAYGLPWQNWKVPICISYGGLFINEEIETAA